MFDLQRNDSWRFLQVDWRWGDATRLRFTTIDLGENRQSLIRFKRKMAPDEERKPFEIIYSVKLREKESEQSKWEMKHKENLGGFKGSWALEYEDNHHLSIRSLIDPFHRWETRWFADSCAHLDQRAEKQSQNLIRKRNDDRLTQHASTVISHFIIHFNPKIVSINRDFYLI